MKNISLLSILLIILSFVNCFEMRALSLSMPSEAQLNRMEKASSWFSVITFLVVLVNAVTIKSDNFYAMGFNALAISNVINVATNIALIKVTSNKKKHILRMIPALMGIMAKAIDIKRNIDIENSVYISENEPLIDLDTEIVKSIEVCFIAGNILCTGIKNIYDLYSSPKISPHSYRN